MKKSKVVADSKLKIQNLTVIDLILIDHRYLKGCIEVLLDESADKRKKMSVGRGFLKAMSLHLKAEKKAVYKQLEKMSEFHSKILEAQVEHGIIDQKIKAIRTKLHGARIFNDEVMAEFKVLADLVKHHIMEEESEILSKMNEFVDNDFLDNLGREFMKIRKFTAEDIKDYPQLHEELIQWKDSIQKVSSEFLSKMDKFVESLHH